MDGSCQILLQVIIGKSIWPHNLKMSWHPQLFDEESGRCITSLSPAHRQPNYKEVLAAATAAAGGSAELLAKQAHDYNLLIGQALAKANEVFVTWRLAKQAPSLERFKQDFNTSGSKDDFVAYFKAKITARYRQGKITEITKKNHTSTLNALVAFRPYIPFNSLTTEFADDFNAYLKRHVRGINTRWGRHKDVKTYLALARKDRMKFEDPYADFKNQEAPGQWKALRPAELSDVEAYYKMCAPRTPHRRVLARFLFSCCSSLRLGDLKNIANADIENREMTFKAQKTYNKTMAETMLPLTKKAMQYLQQAQEEEGLPGFFDYSDQYANRMLTAIGQQLGIESRIHNHVGRETFATEFVRRGGNVAVLQKLMGHSKLSTTMKYVHVDNDMKRAEIDRMDALDEA